MFCRTLIADRLNVASSSVHGYIIGEHGETSGTYLHCRKGQFLSLAHSTVYMQSRRGAN